MEEIWRKLEDFSNYEVSSSGRVRNIKTGRILKPGVQNGGYLIVDLYKDGKHKLFLIHRLVASVFIPNPENKRDVNHISGCKTDNRVENLEYVTRSENIKHAFRSGLSKITNNHISNQTKQRVRCIETGQEFESISSACRYFGCGHGSIYQSINKGSKVLKKYHFELI